MRFINKKEKEELLRLKKAESSCKEAMTIKLLKAFNLAVALSLALAFLLNIYLEKANLYFNVSASLPKGLYKAQEDLKLKRGDLILLCLDEAQAQFAFKRGYLGLGSCKNNLAPVGKRILALSGDEIAINHRGITVNNHLLPNTAPIRADQYGRTLPSLNLAKTLEQGEMLVGNLKSDSFDSRYFGLVLTSQVQAKIEAFY